MRRDEMEAVLGGGPGEHQSEEGDGPAAHPPEGGVGLPEGREDGQGPGTVGHDDGQEGHNQGREGQGPCGIDAMAGPGPKINDQAYSQG